MKIGICVNSYHPWIGGAEKVCQKLAEYLSVDNEVIVFTKYTNKRREEDYQNYSVVGCSPGNWNEFSKLLESKDLDILFIYGDVFDYFAHIISSKQKYKVVVALCGANWVHRHDAFYNTFRRQHENIDKIVLHSTRERDFQLCEKLQIMDKVKTIPNGVDLEEFDNNQLTRENLLPGLENKYWVLNISNFFPGKNQNDLINIISRIPSKSEIVYIQICSDIQFSIGKVLENRWRDKSLSLMKDRVAVRLMKNISRERVVGFLKNSNVFAFTTEKEVFPLVLIEAMACRLPWVATDVGNAMDLKGGSCILARKNYLYHNQFEPVILDNFAQQIMTARKTNEGRKQVEECFTWDKILPQYFTLFKKVFQ